MCQYRGPPHSWVGCVQSGTSRAHFEMWCEDRRNGVIIADFAVQGTLAREILGSPSEVMTRAGIKVRVARLPYHRCGAPRLFSSAKVWF